MPYKSTKMAGYEAFKWTTCKVDYNDFRFVPRTKYIKRTLNMQKKLSTSNSWRSFSVLIAVEIL
jgi:hypothetical protein